MTAVSERTIAAPAVSTWSIDPAHTDVEFAIRHLMVSNVKGHLAPYGERVDLIVDGELQERPAGPLGRGAKMLAPRA